MVTLNGVNNYPNEIQFSVVIRKFEMSHYLQKLPRIFRRKPEQHFICGNVLIDMTLEQHEKYIAACKKEPPESADKKAR